MSGLVRVITPEGRPTQTGGAAPAPMPETLHANWRNLIEYCRQNPFVSMRLNIADGVPMSAEEVVPTLRFDKPDPRGRMARPGSG